MEFQASPSRIGQVRHMVCAQLRYWNLDPLVDTTALAVTELLANVHRHTGPDKRCSVELVLQGGRLTVSVRDLDPRLPELRTATSWATNGRGLALVAALSASWGTRPQRGGAGKIVWFTLPPLATAPRQGAGTLVSAQDAARPSSPRAASGSQVESSERGEPELTG